MSFHRRIRTIYGKELIDILRDRRTLVAMIVVPIVLYPLLMLGSIQAVSFQTSSMATEEIHFGVLNEQQGVSLDLLIKRDAAALERERASLEPGSGSAEDAAAPLEKYAIYPFGSRERLDEQVRNRSIHVGVLFDRDALVTAPDLQNHVEFLVDSEDVRSTYARNRIEAVIERTAERINAGRKAAANLPPTFDSPFVVSSTDLSSPPSILGQILPLVLVLMTITGAIYPAIDLTAGERERGTLESLMVCPVPVFDLIVGKFLVVTTVAIMGAALNLASVTATVYFGGFDKMIAQTGGSLPIAKMLFILLCLIPFAVLMSAIMIAVCSYARTFKEAQNYVTPVILAVLIPGGIAALPTTRLEGIMLVMPVGNMVLLARDFLLGAVVPATAIASVVISTTLYAGAAVAIAASIFGRESVVFADSGSLKAAFSRSLMKPSSAPSASMSLLLTSLLFPLWFFVQAAFSPKEGEDASGLLFATGWLMPPLFVLLPFLVLAYWKIDVLPAFSLRAPRVRHMTAGVLIGASAWVIAHEMNVVQGVLFGIPEDINKSAEIMLKTITQLPPVSVFVLLALVPAICEELLFRGFLLSGLGSSGRAVAAVVGSAAVFAVFHFMLFKMPVTFTFGVVLAFLCWRSGSIWPGMLAHFLHNAIGAYSAIRPNWYEGLGIPSDTDWVHLPPRILITGFVMFVAGLVLGSARGSHPTTVTSSMDRAEVDPRPAAAAFRPNPVERSEQASRL